MKHLSDENAKWILENHNKYSFYIMTCKLYVSYRTLEEWFEKLGIKKRYIKKKLTGNHK
jgi:hypothetical protein